MADKIVSRKAAKSTKRRQGRKSVSRLLSLLLSLLLAFFAALRETFFDPVRLGPNRRFRYHPARRAGNPAA
jgi:hypothetical protein